jgi:hypothetical protein
MAYITGQCNALCYSDSWPCRLCVESHIIFPPLQYPSNSGFYAVGDMDMVSQSQIYGNISMLLAPRQLSVMSSPFSEIKISPLSTEIKLNTPHTNLIPGASSVCSVGNLVIDSEIFALLERFLLGLNQVSNSTP